MRAWILLDFFGVVVVTLLRFPRFTLGDSRIVGDPCSEWLNFLLPFLLRRVGLPGVIGDSGTTTGWGAPCSDTLSFLLPFLLLRRGLPGVIGDTTSDSAGMMSPCSERLSFLELLHLLLRLGLPGVTGGDRSDTSGSTPCSERLSFLDALLLLLFRRSVVAGLSGGGGAVPAAPPCSDDRLRDFILLGFLLPLLLLRLAVAVVGLVAFSSNSRSRLLRDFGLPLLTRLVTPGVGESKAWSSIFSLSIKWTIQLTSATRGECDTKMFTSVLQSADAQWFTSGGERAQREIMSYSRSSGYGL